MLAISSKITMPIDNKDEELFLFNKLSRSIKSKFSSCNISKNSFLFTAHDFIHVSVPIIITWNSDSNNFNFKVKIESNKILYTSLILLLVFSFLIFHSLTLFVSIAFPFIIVIAFVQHQSILLSIERIFDDIKESIEKKEFEIQKQAQWLHDYSKCPACGDDITEYHEFCSECGIYIQKTPDFSRFSISENLSEYALNYIIIDEKN